MGILLGSWQQAQTHVPATPWGWSAGCRQDVCNLPSSVGSSVVQAVDIIPVLQLENPRPRNISIVVWLKACRHAHQAGRQAQS